MLAKLKTNLLLVLAAVALLWAVEAANLLTGHNLNDWGILPRTVTGLSGIPLSPFIHGSLSHLLVNTVPFLVLGALVALQGRRAFFGVSLFVTVTGGAAVWLFGRSGYHIGASGLIFGFFGYLVARGWYERSLRSILIALATLFFYGGPRVGRAAHDHLHLLGRPPVRPAGRYSRCAHPGCAQAR